METIQTFDPMTAIILLTACVVMVIVLFAKFIRLALKLAIIAVMLLIVLYFLRQMGLV